MQCFSPRRRRRYKVARARAVFPTQGAGLFPKRRACPLQQHRSLLIEKKQVQIHPSCLHSQSLSLYLLLSLSPFGSFPFCLVYFLMYKSSNASDRTFFFSILKKNDNNSALYVSPFFFFFGYRAPAVWQCVVYHAREREREKEGWVLCQGMLGIKRAVGGEQRGVWRVVA